MRSKTARRIASRWLLVAAIALGAAGCESMQRKFTRKPKTPPKPETPVIQFEDYTKSVTPLSRYRKHFVMFSYWNHELIDVLRSQSPNQKRLREASAASLHELQGMRRQLRDDVATRLDPILQERAALDDELQRAVRVSNHDAIRRAAELHGRTIRRKFTTKDVEDAILDVPETPPAAEDVAAP